MSAESSLVTREHFDYIAARTTPEDPFLAQLRVDAEAAGIPPIHIAPEQAAFLQILLRASNVRELVEVGTLAGYSAIAMARAVARVRTIEFNPMHAQFARDAVAKSDVADRVEVFEGSGEAVLAGFEDDSADAAFLDADKANYPLYLEESLRIVRQGGLILVDNAFAFGQLFDENPTDPEAPAVQAFNEIMAADTRVTSVILPVGDGLWVGVKN